MFCLQIFLTTPREVPGVVRKICKQNIFECTELWEPRAQTLESLSEFIDIPLSKYWNSSRMMRTKENRAFQIHLCPCTEKMKDYFLGVDYLHVGCLTLLAHRNNTAMDTNLECRHIHFEAWCVLFICASEHSKKNYSMKMQQKRQERCW